MKACLELGAACLNLVCLALCSLPPLIKELFFYGNKLTTLPTLPVDLQNARVLAAVESDKYDCDLPALIDIGRNMFRQDKLEQIARANAATPKFKDEIEVCFAYLIELRVVLKLTLPVQAMRFFDMSGVKREDFKIAGQQVKSKENSGFLTWLLQWVPWEGVMRRVDERLYVQMKKALYEQLETIEPIAIAELKQLNLNLDTDAIRIKSKEIEEKLSQQLRMRFTQDFLVKKDLLNLLDPYWKGENLLSYVDASAFAKPLK